MERNEFIGTTFLKYFLGSAGAAIISFFTVPFMTRILSPAEYGKGMMYITVISLLFVLCNCGMDQSYVRFYYESDCSKSRLRLLYTCLAVIGIVFSVVFFILLFIYKRVLLFFFEDKTFFLYLTILIGTLVFILNRFRLLSLRMQKRAVAYSLGQILTQLFYALTVIGLYFFYHIQQFTLIVYAQIFSLLSIFLIFFVIDFKSWRFFGLQPCKEKYINIKEVFQYGWPFFFSFILIWLFQSIDRVALLKWSNYNEVGIYSAAFSLIAPLTMIQGVFTTMWAPMANEMLIKKPDESKKTFADIFHIMLFFMAVGAVLVMLCNPLIIKLLGEKYRGASQIFSWLLFSPFFYLLSELVIGGILITKKSKLNVLISIVSVLANTTACYFFIPWLGGYGAAISLALGYLIFFCVRLFISFRYYSFQICWWKLIFVISLLIIAAGILWHTCIIRLIVLTILLLLFQTDIKCWTKALIARLKPC